MDLPVPDPKRPPVMLPNFKSTPQQGFVDHDASTVKGGPLVNDNDLDDGAGVMFKRPVGKN